jgi:mono/diheme cytochrome c family protein
MKVTRMLLACALVLSHGRCVLAGEPAPDRDLPAQVRSIFLAKCAECHGRSLSRPRAGLYLHELGQLAANPEWVVPHEPEQSYLWTLVRDDDMPAKGAKAGPLNQQEKEVVRAWIAAGASVPRTSSVQSPGAMSDGVPGTAAPAPSPLVIRLFAWLGRFHVLVIHFPIALLLAAALGELIAALRGNQTMRPAVRFCVLLGAAGALAAALLGWLHADVGGHGSSAADGILGLHRWLGAAASLIAIAIALSCEWDHRRGQRSLLFRVLLWSGAALTAITAHYGGLLVHGRDFLDW